MASTTGTKNNAVEILMKSCPLPLPLTHPISHKNMMQYLALECLIHVANSDRKQKKWNTIANNYKEGLKSFSSFWNLPSKKYMDSDYYTAKKLSDDFEDFRTGSLQRQKIRNAKLAQLIYPCQCYKDTPFCSCKSSNNHLTENLFYYNKHLESSFNPYRMFTDEHQLFANYDARHKHLESKLAEIDKFPPGLIIKDKIRSLVRNAILELEELWNKSDGKLTI